MTAKLLPSLKLNTLSNVILHAIAAAAKFQLFEFNDAFTRAQFVSLLTPFLRDVQGRRGLYDFKVICNESNNTGQVIDNNEFVVKNLKKIDGQIVHVIEGPKPEVGLEVDSIIDWDHRYKLMRTHTALHILCGVIWRDYGASVTGGDMKPLSGRMDFELDQMSVNFSKEVEQKINKEIELSRNIKVYDLPRDEAFQIPDLIRTKINLLPKGINEIRIVDIEGLDLQADGGTHVHNTSEVGYIKMTGHQSKGKNNKRLRIEVSD